jgi:uncharacterized phage-associated protein
MVPFANVEDTRKIWEIEVSNIKTVYNDVADYSVCLIDNNAKKVWNTKVLKHKRDAGLARLLSKVFKKMDEELWRSR